MRGHDQTVWQAPSKGKERTSWLFLYLPLHAAIGGESEKNIVADADR